MNGSPKTAVQRVADAVRYWSERLGGGAPLPSQEELAEQFNVSRDTVQKALKLLSEEGLIDSIRGSGTFVAGAVPDADVDGDELEPAILALGPHLDRAFQAPHVTIDFFGFTAETLAKELTPRLVRVWLTDSTPPESLHIRLLLPDMERLAVPRAVDAADDPRPLERLRGVASRSVGSLREAVEDLRSRNAVLDSSLEVRTVPMTPQVKLFVINKDLALRGWYKLVRRKVELPERSGSGMEDVDIYDFMGLDANLLLQRPHAVAESQEWFDSLWSIIAVDSKLSE
ncbi:MULTISPECIES: GntR family transcriptional regulator [Streptacidiphilus]|uniref:Winged helix-turn-helix domain-containing protein n=1 Tax=Streptacidiphilus cavernicola TaxID=3342716 RepID=A0ABV6UM19_9ACTN|nr:GntR family transcriptional regulator [Streptacidiphilus jeojiense]